MIWYNKYHNKYLVWKEYELYVFLVRFEFAVYFKFRD